MVILMKSTFLVTALSVTIYLLEVNFCDAQNQSSSERGRMYEIRAKSRYRPSSLLRLESYPKILEPQNLEYDSSEYVMDKDVEFSGPEVTAQPISILSEYDIGIDSNTNEGRNNYERPEVKRQQNNRLQNDRWAELEDEAFEYYDSNNYYGINETQELKQDNISIATNSSSPEQKKKMCLLGREFGDDSDDGLLRSGDEGNLESMYTIIVEGNIASGKTTFVNLFKRYQQVMVLPEPVEEWQNVNGTDLLDLMFHNGTRYFGTFQLESTFTRLKQALKIPPPPSQNHGVTKTIRLIERSLFSERYVFLEGAHQSGQISNPEYALMKQWFNFSVDKFRKQVIPDLIVYLRCPLDILKQRIRKRGRPEEQTIDWGFVENMQKKYDDYLFYKNSSFPIPSKVMVLDGGLSLDNFALSVHNQLPSLFPSWKLLRGLQRRKSGRGKKL